MFPKTFGKVLRTFCLSQLVCLPNVAKSDQELGNGHEFEILI